MKKIKNWLSEFNFPEYTLPIVLFGLSVISYGIMIPWLGYYWDDLPFVYITQNLGPQAITQYFSTKRPVLGLLYQITTPLIGKDPLNWQIFGVFWRWANAVVLWWLIRLIWRKQPRLAAWVSILFLLYPGFDQQYIPIAYSHYFITLTSFFLSIACTVLSIRKPRRFWLFTILALITSAFNLFTTEYFFMLDLLRIPILWIVLKDEQPLEKVQFKKLLTLWLPYLAVFLAPSIWRIFFFQYQTYSYDPLLLADLKAAPLQTILKLLGTIVHDFWYTSLGAWAKAFQIPSRIDLGKANFLRYLILAAGTAVGMLLYLLKFSRKENEDSAHSRHAALQMFLLGTAGILIAGWPFWITKLPISLSFSNSRFTLSFMLGVSFLFAGLLGLLPDRKWLRIPLLSIALGFAVGLQFQIALDYRIDWERHKDMIWQMTWRMPQLEPGTLIIGNYNPGTHYSDNSLTAPLNYIYAPENRSQELSYMFYYPSVRFGRKIMSWEKDVDVEQDYLVGVFHGSTSQTVSLYFKSPDCVRILDPDIDVFDPKLDELMLGPASISSTDPILPASEQEAAVPMPEIYGSEPQHEWCYYYEKADLARQIKDWEDVIALGQEAQNQGYAPKNPIEQLPFIEAYAHTNDWQAAQTLTIEALTARPDLQLVLCKQWSKIDIETLSSPEKDAALKSVQENLNCEN